MWKSDTIVLMNSAAFEIRRCQKRHWCSRTNVDKFKWYVHIYIYLFIYIYIHCICTWISVCKRSAYLCAYSPYLGVDPSVLCVMLWYKEATMDVDIWRSLSQMIHLWKMCTRTGLVSYVKCSGLPTALHSFNSCECLIQVLFSVPPEPQLVAFILRGIRAVWMVSLANVTQAVAVWHFTTLSVLYWEWLRPTVLSQSQKWSKFCGLSPDHHSPPRTSQNLNPLEVSRSPQLICRADLAMDELLRFLNPQEKHTKSHWTW